MLQRVKWLTGGVALLFGIAAVRAALGRHWSDVPAMLLTVGVCGAITVFLHLRDV